MASVPYHTHTFEIPTASSTEIADGVVSNKVVVPSELALAMGEIVEPYIGAATPPALLQPGVKLAQRVYMMPRRATGFEELSGEYFSNATRAPQGATAWKHSVSGRRILLTKQRTATPGGVQYYKFFEHTLSYAGATRVAPDTYGTTDIGLSHQGIGNFAHSSPDRRWLVTGASGLVGTIPSGKGIALVEYKGAATAQADVREIKVLATASGSWSSKLDASFICSTDGKWLIAFCNNSGNPQGSDERSILVVWDLAAVLAAPSNDATSVRPVAVPKPLPRMAERDASSYQDYECDGRYIYAVTGSTGPTMRHYLIVVDMWTGDPVRVVPVDTGRAKYTDAQLRAGGLIRDDGTEIGLPASFEMECIAKIDGEDTIYLGEDESWGLPGSIFSYPMTPGKNWAIGDPTSSTLRPGQDRAYRETTLAATAGDWSYFATGLTGQGSNTRVGYNVIEVRVADGASGETPCDQALLGPRGNATLMLGDNYFDIGINPTQSFRIGRYAPMADLWTEYARISEGELKLWDTSANGKYPQNAADSGSAAGAGVANIWRTTTDGLRSWIGFTHPGNVDVRFYGDDDALSPSRVSFSGNLTYSPTNGLDVANGTAIRIGGLKVVGARSTGWSADTGTTRKTANATYARTYTAPANFAAAGAAYVQAVQTDVQNRIQNLEAEVAALTTAMTVQSQKFKTVLDAMINAGSIGA